MNGKADIMRKEDLRCSNSLVDMAYDESCTNIKVIIDEQRQS